MDTSAYWMGRATRRLKGYENVTLVQGDIRHLTIEEGSFDVVLVHLVLHDIEPGDRQGIVDALATVLRPGGTLYIREPTGEHHGMPAEEIRSLMHHAGLGESPSTRGKSLLTGPLYAGVFVKD